MADSERPPSPPAEQPGRTDRSPWNWLLLLPIVIPLLTFLYNGTEPRLFGFPRFYWMQLSFIGLGVISTGLVYLATRRHRKP